MRRSCSISASQQSEQNQRKVSGSRSHGLSTHFGAFAHTRTRARALPRLIVAAADVLSDPDARPIRKGKLGRPTEFGYVAQLAELTENTRRGARGLILPPQSNPGNPAENMLLPSTVAELQRLGLSPREVAVDGGFQTGPTREALSSLELERLFISGRQQPGSRRTQRRLQRYRQAAKAGSVPSNAATASAAAASKATRANRSGPAGRSSPTTSTPSPSEPAEKLKPLLTRAPITDTNGRVSQGAAVALTPGVFPRQVARLGGGLVAEDTTPVELPLLHSEVRAEAR